MAEIDWLFIFHRSGLCWSNAVFIRNLPFLFLLVVSMQTCLNLQLNFWMIFFKITERPDNDDDRTHTEVRELAIRREMEKIILARKLQECADDWATPVEDLSPIVRKPAEQWAKGAVSESVVQQVLTAWLF